MDKIKLSLNKWMILGFFLSVLLSSCSLNKQEKEFFYPADFHKTETTHFIFSTDFFSIVPKLVATISQKDEVTLFLGSNYDPKNVNDTLLKHNSNLDNVRFINIDGKLDENIWIRDFGPVFLINSVGEKKMVQFDYFSSKYNFVEEYGKIKNMPVIKSSLNSTGGSREVNGKGTMILVEAHELDVNEGKTKEEIEKEMYATLNIKKIIWLKRGIPQDDNVLNGPLIGEIYPKGVNGHIDEFCRFVDPNTILISRVEDWEAQINPILNEAKKRLDENYRILVNATDQDGNKFNVIRVPYAPLIITDRRNEPIGKVVTSVTSYMNYIVTNSFVIVPSYMSDYPDNNIFKKKEQELEQLFNKLYPNREIVFEQASTLNYFSGGFHCISLNEPKAK